MKVMVDLEPRDVWRIQERAETLGVTPGEVLRDELAQRRTGRDLRDAIRERVKAGMCDADIAAEFRMTTAAVSYQRRGLGLPANRRYQRRTA